MHIYTLLLLPLDICSPRNSRTHILLNGFGDNTTKTIQCDIYCMIIFSWNTVCIRHFTLPFAVWDRFFLYSKPVKLVIEVCTWYKLRSILRIIAGLGSWCNWPLKSPQGSELNKICMYICYVFTNFSHQIAHQIYAVIKIDYRLR